MLNRMTELATKSANGTIQNNVDREAIQAEIDQLTEEIDRIGDSTNFNGINLLDGNLGSKIGAPANVGSSVGTHVVAEVAANAGKYTSGAVTAGTDGTTYEMAITVANADGSAKEVKVSYKAGASAAGTFANLKTAIEENKGLSGFNVSGSDTGVVLTSNKTGTNAPRVTNMTGGAGVAAGTPTAATDSSKTITLTDAGVAVGNTIEIDGKKYEMVASGAEAKKGNIGFTDLASLVAATEKNGVALSSSGALATDDVLTIQYDATTANKGLSLQVGDTNDAFNKVTVQVEDVRSAGLGIKGLDVSTSDAAGASIDVIKSAINNLDVTAENMTSANSRIRDTDMAKEMMNYTKMNVLTQAAQAMLAQANQQPQSILQLLQ